MWIMKWSQAHYMYIPCHLTMNLWKQVPCLCYKSPLWPREAVYQRRLVPVTCHAQGRSPGVRPLSSLACHPMTGSLLSLYITPAILYPHSVTLSATFQVKEKLSQIEKNCAVKFQHLMITTGDKYFEGTQMGDNASLGICRPCFFVFHQCLMFTFKIYIENCYNLTFIFIVAC